MRPLSLQEAEYLAHELARRLFNYDEPIPPFETRYTGVLESCLATPFIQFDGIDLYDSFNDKAAVLFYGVIKNHPFINGNKRMAVMLLLTFHFIHNRWINVTPDSLYSIACTVAKSDAQSRDGILRILSSFFNDNPGRLIVPAQDLHI